MKELLMAIFLLLLFSVPLYLGNELYKKNNENRLRIENNRTIFMEQCLQDKKLYECKAIWKLIKYE